MWMLSIHCSFLNQKLNCVVQMTFESFINKISKQLTAFLFQGTLFHYNSFYFPIPHKSIHEWRKSKSLLIQITSCHIFSWSFIFFSYDVIRNFICHFSNRTTRWFQQACILYRMITKTQLSLHEWLGKCASPLVLEIFHLIFSLFHFYHFVYR